MKKQELINAPRIMFPVGTEVLIKGKIVGLKALDDRFVENVVKLAYGEQIIAPNDAIYVKDEPEAGQADEAPRYVKNILARLRELPLHDREVWLKAIMSEFEQDFSHAKWREGYEQGKFEGAMIPYDAPEKVTIPKFVADWIEECKAKEKRLLTALLYTPEKVNSWVDNSENQELFAQAWIFGYEVEEEKRYLVKMKNILDRESFLNLSNTTKIWFFGDKKDTEYVYVHHTRKELEEAGFGWVFDCSGVQIEEVKDE
ncbi:DUF1642 domain-containing protein [Streptococcus pneumoniae]